MCSRGCIYFQVIEKTTVNHFILIHYYCYRPAGGAVKLHCKGIRLKAVNVFDEFSPSSDRGGEASEASSRPVPAGVTATQRGARADQQSRGAGLFWRGVTMIDRM